MEKRQIGIDMIDLDAFTFCKPQKNKWSAI